MEAPVGMVPEERGWLICRVQSTHYKKAASIACGFFVGFGLRLPGKHVATRKYDC
jgi:hypothetical protein